MGRVFIWQASLRETIIETYTLSTRTHTQMQLNFDANMEYLQQNNSLLWNSLLEIYKREKITTQTSLQTSRLMDNNENQIMSFVHNQSGSSLDQTPTWNSNSSDHRNTTSSLSCSAFSIENLIKESPEERQLFESRKRPLSPTELLPAETEQYSPEDLRIPNIRFVPFPVPYQSSPIATGSQENDRALFRCPRCPKEYALKSSLKLHEATHTMPFECCICARRFSRRWLLNSHERIHTGERPFACELCGKRFADKSNMRNHVRNHH